MNVESRVGASVAALREYAGMTQLEVAALAVLPLELLAAIEVGAVEPSAETVARIAKAIVVGLQQPRQ